MDKLLLILILYLSLTKATFFLPKVPDVLFYGCFMFTFVWLLVRGVRLSFSMVFFPFLLAILASILVNDIPAMYQLPLRLAGFLGVAFLLGPFWRNTLLNAFRKRLFIVSLWIIEWITLFSFIGAIVGLPWVKIGVDFRGFSNYSMLMGPLAGISFCYSLYLAYAAETKGQRMVGILKATLSLLVVVLAGSRAALGGTIISMLFFMGKIYHFQLIRLLQVGVVASILAAATVSLWLPMAERMIYKMEYGEKQGSVTASRDALWMNRVQEFQSSPFFGVGFASFGLNGVRANDLFMKGGTIEPGSSWLFLLSSMGLAGFLSFLLPAFSLFFKLYRSKDNYLRSAFLGSLLVLLLSHMFFEGYVVAAGAYLCFFLWLLLSECDSHFIKNQKEKI